MPAFKLKSGQYIAVVSRQIKYKYLLVYRTHDLVYDFFSERFAKG